MHSIASSQPADRLVASAALLTAMGFVGWTLSIASIDDTSHLAFMLLILAWIASPYLLIGGAAILFSSTWTSRAVLVAALVGCASFGAMVFSYVDEDAQGGLVLLFAPGYQIGGAFLAVLIVFVRESWRA